MSDVRVSLLPILAAALSLTGCASSPETEQRMQEIEADINEILSLPLDEQQYGSTRRCLGQGDYNSFRPLDEKHILFVGTRKRLWINTLRSKCPDLRYGDVLVIRHFSGTQLCKDDHFTATDWFEWPWYRRSPVRWGSTWGTGIRCTLGEFQPVTGDQVAEIDSLLKERERR